MGPVAAQDLRLKSLVADYVSARSARDATAVLCDRSAPGSLEGIMARQTLAREEASLAALREDIVNHVVSKVMDELRREDR